jgi:NADH-quinone oxidoreductase subunit N
LAALMRVFIIIFPSISEILVPVLWVLAGLTMVVGNVLAVAQNNLKRLMAYSSIAHSGYLLMAFVSYNQKEVLSDAIASMLFYLVAYAIATFGVWAVIIAMERADGNGLEIDDYAGLGTQHPWLAVPMAIFMFSFTGIPMTLGFWGKLYLFRTAIEGGFVSLAIIGVLASVISAYFYLKVILTMFMRSGTPIVRREIWLNFLAIGAAFALVILSLMPNTILNLVLQATINLL